MRKNLLTIGEPAPWFTGRCTTNPQFHFDSVAGRYVVLCFFGTAGDPASQKILNDFIAHRDRFDDTDCCFFGVSIDPVDEQLGGMQEIIPGIRYFWDFDREISSLYGSIVHDAAGTSSFAVAGRFTLVLDERLRTLAVFPFDSQPEQHVHHVLSFLASLPPIGIPTLATVQAPILVVPRVFEPELCNRLIELYEQHGGYDSGFMRDVNGKTVVNIGNGEMGISPISR